jgi:hypothetical protein
MHSLIIPLSLLASQSSFFSPPNYLTRADWGAKPIVAPFKTHKPTRITIHHAGVPTNRNRTFVEMLKALQTFSQREDKLASGQSKPAWPDIPYHWYISWTGELAECRDMNVVGDTNTEYDPTGHILICLEGNFEVEEPTGAQIIMLNRTVFWLAARFNVRPEDIQTHMDFSKQTDCPGKNLYAEIKRIRGRWGMLKACETPRP